MIRFILIRLLQTALNLFGIVTLVFLLGRFAGDPPALLVARGHRYPEYEERIKKAFGVDKPLSVQYISFLKNLVKGDLGKSVFEGRPVSKMIAKALPSTLILSISSLIICLLLSFFLGILAAVKHDSIFDNGVKFLVIVSQAMPIFWVGNMSILIFFQYLNLVSPSPTGGIERYILPVFVLSFYMLPLIMRLVRSSMLDVLDSEYIKLSRIKGVPERLIIWKHALRNAIIAPMTVSGMLLASLITGVVPIEQVFSLGGIGLMSIRAMIEHDYPVLQGITLMTSAVILLINLLVDILYAVVDPQIRYQRI